MDTIGFVQPLKPKLPCALQLSTHFAAYISSAYNQDPKEYLPELKQLDAMREAAIYTPTPTSMTTYIYELQRLPTRFPVDADNIKLAIGWYNSWPTGDKPKPLALFSLEYEQAAIMFNLAVHIVKMGNVEIVGDGTILRAKNGAISADNLKAACNYYVQAAGIFDSILPLSQKLNIPANCDLHTASIAGLKLLMLAEAQECCFWKGVLDGNFKEGVLAKVAFAAHDYYAAAVQEFGHLPALCASLEGKFVITAAACKSIIMQIMAEMKKAVEERSSKKYADELGRLQHVNDVLVPKLLTIVEASRELQPTARSIQDGVLRECIRAKKDNQLIYHEIPTTRPLLSVITGFSLVKPVPCALSSDETTSKTGLFESLIPLRLHQAMTRYQRLKQDRVNQIIADLNRCKSVIESTLQRNNLPGALEAVEQPIGLPETLKAKMRELQSHGGLSGIQASIDLIKQLSVENTRQLADAEHILRQEQDQDDHLRRQFGTDWKRPRSQQSASTYHDKIMQVRQAMQTAAEADAVISSRLERYGRDLELMCGSGSVSEEAVAMLIPASHASNRLTPAARVALDRMRQWMHNVDGVLVDMQRCMTDLNGQADHDHPIKALSAGVANEATLANAITDELTKYTQYDHRCREFMDRAQSLITALDGLVMRDFKQTTIGTGADSVDRQSALQRLDDAYKHYLLINKDLADGIKFYTSLQEPLGRLRDDIADYATSRAVEAEELVDELRTRTLSSPSSRGVMSPIKTPTEVFPAGSAPADPWTFTGPSSGAVYPGARQWMPGMPIQYAANTKNSTKNNYNNDDDKK